MRLLHTTCIPSSPVRRARYGQTTDLRPSCRSRSGRAAGTDGQLEDLGDLAPGWRLRSSVAGPPALTCRDMVNDGQRRLPPAMLPRPVDGLILSTRRVGDHIGVNSWRSSCGWLHTRL